MWMFIGIVSFLSWIVFGIMWIVSLIRKSGKAKRNILTSIACFILFVAAVSFDTSNADVVATDDSVETAKLDTEVVKASVEVVEPVETPEEKEKREEDDVEAAEATKTPPTPEPTTTPVVAQKSVSETAGQRNAVRAAKNYLDFTAFSRQGLIDQLTFEEYSDADAKYAVDKIGADWNEQAAKTAKNYLDYSAFSKQELINQLEFEGYTSEQAIYGANKSYE